MALGLKYQDRLLAERRRFTKHLTDISWEELEEQTFQFIKTQALIRKMTSEEPFATWNEVVDNSKIIDSRGNYYQLYHVINCLRYNNLISGVKTYRICKPL
jgi:uncharacterized linocin/CFP29 family protein